MQSRRGLLFLGLSLLGLSLGAIGCDVGETSNLTGGQGGEGGAQSTMGMGGSTPGVGGSGGAGASGASSGPGSSSSGSSSSSGTGGSGGAPPVPPGGYYVQGNKIYDENGNVHVFRGLARPSHEWTPQGENVSLADFQKIKGWGANVTRLSLNQGFWLPGHVRYDGQYQQNIDQAIQWALQAGLDVILDLHWSDRGDMNNWDTKQQRMADQNSVKFWQSVAEKYKNNGRVLFELYNEPRDVSWQVWRSGGDSGEGFQAVGMQQLYDTVRATGAQNLVLIGGLDWAFDLSGVTQNRIQGTNIVYVTHPYDFESKQPGTWEQKFGFLAATDPVFITEFGSFDCSTNYTSQLLDYAKQRGMSWTGWAWYPGGCGFPALITNWNGDPSAPGQIVKSALQNP